MKGQIALYEYLYCLIVSQIRCGILRRDQRFPSQTELCLQYNVGITTARKVILDILEGFRLILPVLQLGGARQYARPEALEAIIASIHVDTQQMELYAIASHFMMELLKAIQDRDFVKLKAGLYEIYDYGREQAMRYINALETHCHEYEHKKTPSPERFMLKNRAHLYTVIARQLHKRILNGEFDHCKYIPSIPELMKEYSISQATAISAVSLLNDIGVVRIIAKKGTAPAKPGELLQPLRMDHGAI